MTKIAGKGELKVLVAGVGKKSRIMHSFYRTAILTKVASQNFYKFNK